MLNARGHAVTEKEGGLLVPSLVRCWPQMNTRRGSLRSPLDNGAAGKERILLRHNETRSKSEACCKVGAQHETEKCATRVDISKYTQALYNHTVVSEKISLPRVKGYCLH